MADASRFPRGQVAIVGIGCTEYSKDSGVGVFDLAARSVVAAVEDAGLSLADVDGLCTFGPNDSIPPNILAQALGIQSLSFYVDQFFGGSVSLTMLGQATLALAAGVADCVVCYRALNGRSGTRLNGSGQGGGGRLPWDMQFKYAADVIAPAQEIALAAQAHMLRHGTTHEDLGRIAVLSRTNALDNERAMMRTPMTMDDYLESRWIVEPFRKFDCCLETDGAVAVVLVRADRAKDLPHRPVLVQGAAWGGGINVVNNGHIDITESPAKPIAKRLYAAAGLGAGRHRVRRALRLLHLQRAVADRGLRLRRAGRRARHAARRRLRPGHRPAAAQHPRRAPLRGLHPRHEPRVRGGRADPG